MGYDFRQENKESHSDAKLIMVGGVRDLADRKRVNGLRSLIKKCGLSDCIIIKENLEWNQLLKLFKESFVGLHTMEDEHFGICLAEYMAAGLITIGHCSGGPLSDIVANIESKHDVKNGLHCSDRGFLCTTLGQYASCFERVFDEYENGNGWMKLRQRREIIVLTN